MFDVLSSNFVMNGIIVANWKMNGDVEFVSRYFDDIKKEGDLGFDLIVAPPFPYLMAVASEISHLDGVYLAGQALHVASYGPFTGCVSANMLADCGCKYVVIGHSEDRLARRLEAKDLSDLVLSACNVGLKVVFCFGEESQEEDMNSVKKELEIVFGGIEAGLLSGMIVAYEPVWSIGTGIVPSEERVSFVVDMASDFFLKKGVEDVKILYGGSVNGKNVKDFVSVFGLAGFMLGGASLIPADVIKIGDALKGG